jgi:hypothetical protein
MIYEAIVITRNPDGGPHIVPMGYREQGEYIVLAPFKPSTTLENLRRSRQAVLNLTDNVAIFAGCLTGRKEWPTVPVQTVDGRRLEDTLAHMELEVAGIEEDEVRPRFLCEIKHRETHAPFRGFNRAQAAVVEAAILISRLPILPPAKIDTEIEYLRIAIDKTAGERERIAWSWLLERIEAFRRCQEGDAG